MDAFAPSSILHPRTPIPQSRDLPPILSSRVLRNKPPPTSLSTKPKKRQDGNPQQQPRRRPTPKSKARFIPFNSQKTSTVLTPKTPIYPPSSHISTHTKPSTTPCFLCYHALQTPTPSPKPLQIKKTEAQHNTQSNPQSSIPKQRRIPAQVSTRAEYCTTAGQSH